MPSFHEAEWRWSGGLVIDQTVRQRLFQFGHTGIGDLGVAQFKVLQFCQSLDMYQACIGNRGELHDDTATRDYFLSMFSTKSDSRMITRRFP